MTKKGEELQFFPTELNVTNVDNLYIGVAMEFHRHTFQWFQAVTKNILLPLFGCKFAIYV